MAEKHRRHPHRLPDYDYTQPGAYFITIVTFHRANLFGEIINGEMVLNTRGNIVPREWRRLPSRFPRIELDEFVIMPNHLHAIIMIVEPDGDIGDSPNRNGMGDISGRGTGDSSTNIVLDESPVPLLRADESHVPLPATNLPPRTGEQFGKPIPGSIPTIIRSFKAAVSFRINLLPGNSGQPVWQRDYYDRVIRNPSALDLARLYILNNPFQWQVDNENTSIKI